MEEFGEHKIPNKLFYWSINIDKDEDWLKKLIARQCPQKLKRDLQKEDNKGLSLEQLCKKVSLEYEEKNIKCDLVFDQINALVSVLRKQRALWIK